MSRTIGSHLCEQLASVIISVLLKNYLNLKEFLVYVCSPIKNFELKTLHSSEFNFDKRKNASVALIHNCL